MLPKSKIFGQVGWPETLQGQLLFFRSLWQELHRHFLDFAMQNLGPGSQEQEALMSTGWATCVKTMYVLIIPQLCDSGRIGSFCDWLELGS